MYLKLEVEKWQFFWDIGISIGWYWGVFKILVLGIVKASLEILGIGIGVKSGIAQVCCTPNILFLRKVGVF